MGNRAVGPSPDGRSLLILAGAGYAGYRMGKRHSLAVALLILSGSLLLAAAVLVYVAVLALETAAAVVMTIVHYAFRSERTWLWMRIFWGVAALSVVQLRSRLRAGRKLPSSVVTPIVIGWLNRWPVTARRNGVANRHDTGTATST